MVFVRVLTTRTEGLEPFDTKIVIAALRKKRIAGSVRFENRYSDTGGMDATTSLGGRHSLHPVPTCLFHQSGEIVTSDFDGNFLGAAICRAFPDSAVLSTLAGEETLVGASEVAYE